MHKRTVIILGAIFTILFLVSPPHHIFAQEDPEALKSDAAKGASLDATGEVLEFGVLDPHRKSYVIEGIEVRHESRRAVPVAVSVTGIRHDESNTALNPEKWLKIAPAEGFSSSESPFRFNVEIRFPKEISGMIVDGLYEGRLKVQSEDAVAPVYMPLRFTVNLPDFMPVPAELSETGVTVPIDCCLPATRSFDISLQLHESDMMNDLPVKVVAPLNIIREDTGESIPQSQISISDGTGEAVFDETIKSGKGSTRIPLVVKVDSPVMTSGLYTSKIAIRGEYGRTLYVPVMIDVAEDGEFWVNRLRYYFLGGISLSILLLLVRPVRLLISRRKRFVGKAFSIRKTGHQVPATWDRYLSVAFSGSGDNPKWKISARNNARLFKKGSTKAEKMIQVEGNTQLIIQGFRNERYELSVFGVNQFGMNVKVQQSPYRSTTLILEGCTYFVLLCLFLGGLYYPQAWCRLLPYIT